MKIYVKSWWMEFRQNDARESAYIMCRIYDSKRSNTARDQ